MATGPATPGAHARKRTTETRSALRARVSPLVTVERNSRASVGKPPALWRAGTLCAFWSTSDQNGRLGADDDPKKSFRRTTCQLPQGQTATENQGDRGAGHGPQA